MKFHVLKLNFDNGELVRLYASEEDINKENIEDCLYRVGTANKWSTGFYMVVGYEDNKYTELLGSYAHSDIRDIAIFSKEVPAFMQDIWDDSIKGENII
ncbi:unknown [Roseburia sp. CAG:182]|nr:unknown [Roseburia sp. CAG:182]